PEQPVGEHPPLRHLGADRVLDGTEVLPAHVGAGPGALEGEDVEELPVRVADVGTVGGARPGGDPEEPEEPDDVVDAQRPGVAERGADGGGERLVPGRAQPPWMERG